METLAERATKEWQSWVDYYQEKLDSLNKTLGDLVQTAKLIDGLGVDGGDVSISYNSISIKFKELQQAREFVSKVLQETGIDKFIKTSHSYSDRLEWGYTVETAGKTMITIYPCEPNKDCIAVKKVNSYTSWVCEKKGGEGE